MGVPSGELRGRLRPAAATGDLIPGHAACAVVAEVGLLRRTSSVREVDAHHGAFSIVDFLSTVVAHENGLSGHDFLLGFSGTGNGTLEKQHRKCK
jgi:hypothetical protein